MNEAKSSMVKCCFWCLKPIDANVTLQENDKMMFESYEPCERCAELFSHGIQVIGVSHTMVMPGMVPVTKDNNGELLYPTGAMFLTSEQWVCELLKDDSEKELLVEVLKTKKMFMPDAIVGAIINDLDEQAPEIPDLVEDNLTEDAVNEED